MNKFNIYKFPLVFAIATSPILSMASSSLEDIFGFVHAGSSNTSRTFIKNEIDSVDVNGIIHYTSFTLMKKPMPVNANVSLIAMSSKGLLDCKKKLASTLEISYISTDLDVIDKQNVDSGWKSTDGGDSLSGAYKVHCNRK